MIELTCTKCKTVLSIDDAFAGGVCRCKHCGTIQTVPKQTKRAALPASVVANGRPDTVGQATGSGTGLDDLAHVVASSGLSGTGLSSGSFRSASPASAPAVPLPAAAASRRDTIVIASIGGAIVVLLGIIIGILVSRGGKDHQPVAKSPIGPAAGTPAARHINPHFLGMPIHSTSLIYVLDRGSGTTDAFDPMRVALQNSLATLPPTTRFQIIFWDVDASPVAIPASGMQPATPEHVGAAHKALLDVYAFGQSKVEPAMGKAMSQKPADIILATGKAGLDDAFVKSVVNLRRGHPVKIHTFSLGNGSPDAMKAIAQQTGGEFREVGFAELREFAQ
jgi:hypothetical protein